MDAFIICNRGLETVCSDDISLLIGDKKIILFEGACVVEDVSTDDLAVLAYRLQSAFHIGVLLAGESDFEGLKNKFLLDELDLSSWKNFVSENSSFAVNTIKIVKHDIPSPDLSASFGETILEFSKKQNLNLKVNLSKPEVSFMVFITDSFCGIGVDIIGFDLSRRPYKLFNHSSALNGVFAHSISRFAGIDKNSVILDPFCNNGTIPIEIALFQNEKSPFVFERRFLGLNYSFTKDSFEKIEESLKKNNESSKNIFGYDEQLKIILSAKKNAKIAGVLDNITFSKVSVDWLDTKFEEQTLDFIISNPPRDSKRLNNPKKIAKMFDELFYQSRFILKKNGLLVLLVFKTEEVISLGHKHGFVLKESKIVFSGQQENSLLIFSRQ